MICHSRPFSINSMPRDGVSWSLYTGGPLRFRKYMASYVLTAQALSKGPIEWDLTQTLHTSRSAPSMRRALERHFQQNHYLWRSILSAADQFWALSPRCIFAVPFRYPHLYKSSRICVWCVWKAYNSNWLITVCHLMNRFEIVFLGIDLHTAYAKAQFILGIAPSPASWLLSLNTLSILLTKPK